MGSGFDGVYSPSTVRFWRVPWHRQALHVLAEAVTRSSEADHLDYEFQLIQAGNRAEYALRQSWADDPRSLEDPTGWCYVVDPKPLYDPDTGTYHEVLSWAQIEQLYGPHRARHRGCLCRWLALRPYPTSANGGHDGSERGGRAKRLIADLDSAVAKLPRGLTEHEIEQEIARLLGWSPPEPLHDESSGRV